MVKEIHPNRIRVVLADKQITNHWLATQLGVTDMTVSRWCTNKNQPSISQLVEIAKLLNVDIKEEEFYKLKYCSTVVYMVPRA
jgi:transcriptional regulator with XRE-family HTH domain